MAEETVKSTSGTKQATESAQWSGVLAGVLFVLTCLLILGFIWQSVASYFFPDQ